MRREFIDDLLCGRIDLGRLAERAERFGLRLAGSHVVAVAQSDHFFAHGDPTTRRQSAMLARFDARDVLVMIKDGMLLCVAPGPITDGPTEFARQIELFLGATQCWRVGIGRPHPGPGGS